MHRILEFREPDDEEFEKFTSEQLKRITAHEISAALQKEEEFLKTLSPNLDAPYDYEKKVLISFLFLYKSKNRIN